MKNHSLRDALRAWRRRKPKKNRGTRLIDPTTGKEEIWIPCKTFAKLVDRSYENVLDLARVRWLPAMEIGDANASICIVPRQRALAAFRRLQKEGRIHK